MHPELKVRKIVGRTYLNENRLAEALDIFSKILLDYPDDLETLLILGNCYLASGDGKTARTLFAHAQELDPENTNISRQVAMAEDMADDGSEELAPTDLASVARLLQRLSGIKRVIEEKDVEKVAFLLEKIINSENPAELVSQHLDEIDELMPALIELNVRQAVADSRPDLVQALRALQLNVDHQLESREVEKESAAVDSPELPPFIGDIMFLMPNLEDRTRRMTTLMPALVSLGCRVFEKEDFIPGRDPLPDVVITPNPHTNPKLLESLSALSASNIPIIIDLDTDFEKQPVTHTEYGTRGLGVHTRGIAYVAMLKLASLVTVPSEEMAATLGEVVQNVMVIPDGWSRFNEMWDKKSSPRHTINLGWLDSSGQLEDLALIRRYIIRIIREFPNTRIAVIGNPQAYRLFESLPEHRRLYLPMVAPDEFPYLLGQLDILMVPLRSTAFNLTLPDTVLMEAGVKGIPWIASPIPSFQKWLAGGVIPSGIEEWHLDLRKLVMDKDLRVTLGKAGRSAAKSREMSFTGKKWLSAVSKVIHTIL